MLCASTSMYVHMHRYTSLLSVLMYGLTHMISVINSLGPGEWIRGMDEYISFSDTCKIKQSYRQDYQLREDREDKT